MGKTKEKTEIKLKRLLDELDALDTQRIKLAIRISRAKRPLIEDCDYVGIIYISRFLSYAKRDRLFSQFLDRYSDSDDGYLFVLAFADSGETYRRAKKIADAKYAHDIDALRENIDKLQDEHLCSFLSEYSTKEDLEWVLNLIEKKDWFKSYKMATSALIELENSSI